MPYRRKTPTYKSKRRVAVRKRQYQRYSPVMKFFRTPRAANVIMPKAIYTKLRFADAFSITTASGVMGFHVFAGNNLYDPNQTGAGQQPAGYDQLTAIYDRYCVYGCKVAVNMQSLQGTGAANSSFSAAIVPYTDSNAAVDTTEEMWMNPKGKWSSISNQYDGVSKGLWLSSYSSPMEMFGKSKQQVLTEDNFSAAVTTGPAYSFYWRIGARALDGVSTLNSIRCQMHMTFWVKFYQIREQAYS